MVSANDNQALFAQLFADETLTPQRIYAAMDDIPFEFFVKYVFEQAGYSVEHTGTQYGPGLDLKVSRGPLESRTLHAGAQVKHFQPGMAKVTAPQITSLRGGLPHISGVVGYFVTTSTFNDPALAEANKVPRIWPVDGDHLVRYIAYVRGTRAKLAKDTENDARLRRNPLAPIPPEVLLAADEIAYRPAKTTRVLALANHKGGVGKTTSALNIAFGLAVQDQQVLLVDMDPQTNLTRSLPSPAPDAVPAHIGEYFTGKRRLGSLVRQTQFPRVWLIPSSPTLTHSDEGIAAGPGIEMRFARDLHAFDIVPPANLDARPFDWIIIDTGPSMGLFTRSAFAASHNVLMPLAPGAFADMGLELLIDTVHTMTALTGHPIEILGCLVTQWQENPTNRQLLAVAAQALNDVHVPMFATKIPWDKPHIEKAHLETGRGRKKNLFTQKCPSAKAYLAFVEEVLGHVNT